MEFWGLAIPPSKQVVGKASKTLYVHVSNAALADVKIPSENERVVLRVKIKEHEFVLGTLIPGKCDQLNLDVIYNTPFIVSHNSKSCSVHLTGYTTEAPDEADDDDDDPLAFQNGAKKKLNRAVELDSSDDDFDEFASSRVPMIGVDEDDEDDDDEEEDDDDEDEDEEDDDEDDDDDDDDEEDDDSDEDEEDESDEDLKISNETLKRKLKSPPDASPADKKIKTPSGKGIKADGKANVKPEVKAEVKTPTAKTPRQEEKKSDKKIKSTPKSTDPKSKGTPGSKLLHHCEPCARNFSNESALLQHNSAKHKK